MNVALVFAGGTGIRMRTTGKPKQFIELYGKAIIIYTLEIFEHHEEIDYIIVPCLSGWEEHLASLVDFYGLKKVKKIITGGANTQESKMKALEALKEVCADDDIVLLHDAVRPLITKKLISDNIASVKRYGSAISAVPFTETAIVSDDGEKSNRTIVRNTLYVAKAPQSFYYSDALSAHTLGVEMPYTITIDTVSLMTELGREVHMVPCESTNIKITTPEDYYIFKALVDLRESRDIFGL